MAGKKKLPPVEILVDMRTRGMRLKEIGALYDVGEPAVWRALERAGKIQTGSGWKDLLPWRIAPNHKTTAVMARFRTILKQKNGEATTPTEERLLRTWLEGMQENNVVVNYHPEAPANSASSKGGFYYVPRTDADQWIIREALN